jgi:uncharacterized membrane protein HdeD (DUF308 family)
MTIADAQTGLGLPLAGPALLRALADNWWLVLLRGIASVAFGCLAFFWPGLTLLTLTFLWGAYAVFDGFLRYGLRYPARMAIWHRVGGSPWSASPVFWPACWHSSGLA